MPNIFISYRREDASAWAGRINDRLALTSKKNKIFIDVDDIDPGADFAKVLEAQVDRCDVLLAIIARNWLAAGASEQSRIFAEDDFVRIEIERALQANITVIPLLVDGAHIPSVRDLPPSLAQLTQRNAFVMSHATFAADVAKLSKIISELPARQHSAGAALLPVDTVHPATINLGRAGVSVIRQLILPGLVLLGLTVSLESFANDYTVAIKNNPYVRVAFPAATATVIMTLVLARTSEKSALVLLADWIAFHMWIFISLSMWDGMNDISRNQFLIVSSGFLFLSLWIFRNFGHWRKKLMD